MMPRGQRAGMEGSGVMRRLWVKTVGEERFIYCYQQGREGAAKEIKRARGCSKGAARRRRRPTGTKTQEGEKKKRPGRRGEMDGGR